MKTIPTLRIGATVRPRVEQYANRRGTVTEHIGNLWAVLLDGDTTETDFSAAELTILE